MKKFFNLKKNSSQTIKNRNKFKVNQLQSIDSKLWFWCKLFKQFTSIDAKLSILISLCIITTYDTVQSVLKQKALKSIIGTHLPCQSVGEHSNSSHLPTVSAASGSKPTALLGVSASDEKKHLTSKLPSCP